MSVCYRCNATVDYCDCIDQRIRNRIAKEVQDFAVNGLHWHNYTVLEDILRVIKGEIMPVPNGEITTTEIMNNLVPEPEPEETEEEEDADKV